MKNSRGRDEFDVERFCEIMEKTQVDMEHVYDIVDGLEKLREPLNHNIAKYNTLCNILTMLILTLDSGYVWQLDQLLINFTTHFGIIEPLEGSIDDLFGDIDKKI